MSASEGEQWVICGRFGRPHGVRGELRLWCHNPNTELLQSDLMMWLADIEDTFIPNPNQTLTPLNLSQYHLLSHRKDSKGLIVKLSGVNSREDAKLLNHKAWIIHRSAFPQLKEDEFYFSDLIGMSGVLDDGDSLGVLRDILEVGSGEVLVFEGPHGEVMVPFVSAFILDLNFEDRLIKIRAVDGLIEGGI